jgi:hypothetical protein
MPLHMDSLNFLLEISMYLCKYGMSFIVGSYLTDSDMNEHS